MLKIKCDINLDLKRVNLHFVKSGNWKFGDRGFEPHSGFLNFKETKKFFPAHSWRINIVGSLRDREVACSPSDCSNFKFCVWREVSSHSSHHPHEVFLAQSSLYMHKNGLKSLSFNFISFKTTAVELSDFSAKTKIRWYRLRHLQGALSVLWRSNRHGYTQWFADKWSPSSQIVLSTTYSD